MNDQPRPVWLTEGEVHFLDRASLRERWDAAPADATQAADDAIAAKYQADGLLYGEHVRHMADAVLRALGRPS